MAVLPRLVVRDDSSTDMSDGNVPITPAMMNLLIALVVLLCFGLFLIAVLLFLRSRRKAKQMQKLADLPFQANRPSSKISNHRRLTVTATPYGRHSQAINVYNEKEIMVHDASQPSSPKSPVPEIRITFPEEEDEGGKRKSGRVVVVRISETGGVGLEPYIDDHLPPYQKSDAERFQSLDLDRMGGLKETNSGPRLP
ncbi:hypothetical protein ABVK25_011958 [Lepraria finkii]|uniref:Uncharacterized protein n=1 Tax=Lepraria finkii TaxID=1340010 RepID=A0ABR4AMJ7_9LECA